MPTQLGREITVRVRGEVPGLGPLVAVVPDGIKKSSVYEAAERLVQRAPTLLQRLPVGWLVDGIPEDRPRLGPLALGHRLHQDEEFPVVEFSCGFVGRTGMLRERQQSANPPA